MSDRRRIVLGEDDFGPPSPPPPRAAAEPPRAATTPSGTLPPVERAAPTRVNAGPRPTGKGEPVSSARALLHDDRFAGLIAAGVGMVIAWVITEILGLGSFQGDTALATDALSGVYFGCIAGIFASVVLGFDRAVEGATGAAARRAGRALVPVLAAGFVAGFVAQAMFGAIVESILDDPLSFSGPDDIRLYVARAVGWTVFGGGVGAVLGFVERSRPLIINRTLGGLAGGAIGGLLFQFTAARVDAPGLSRLIGLLGIGLLVAAATRFVEHARREAWLRVVAGGMSGKEFILYHEVTRIGSSPECEIFLIKDPGVAPEHARIADEDGRRTLTAAAGAVVLVDQQPITSHRLRNGERIQIGNSAIAYSERTVAGAA